MNEKHWGRKARAEGLPKSACPYTGILPRQQWIEGWNEEDQRLQIAENREHMGLKSGA